MAHKKRASDKNGECKVKSLRSLRRLLSRHKVDFSKWGEGKSKTINKLMKEVRRGETQFYIQNGRLRRHTRHSLAHVYCLCDGILYELYEDTRTFHHESGDLAYPGKSSDKKASPAVSEKLQAGEEWKQAMIRCLQEELGLINYRGQGLAKIHEKPQRRHYGRKHDKSDECASYPGLSGVRIDVRFVIMLPVEFFVHAGYVEKLSHRTTTFMWREIGVDEVRGKLPKRDIPKTILSLAA